MSTQTKVRICSSILREPQIFDKLGDLAGGIARDLVIWAAWNNVEENVFMLPHFCEVMGYSRQHLLKKIGKAHTKILIEDKGLPARAAEVLGNSVGYALAMLATTVFTFTTTKPPRVNGKGEEKGESIRMGFENTISEIDLEVKRTGTVVKFKLNQQLLARCRSIYQTIILEEYLSLRTDKGQPDDAARKLYLRLMWKRKYWDKTKPQKGYYPSRDSYDDLKKVVRLGYAQEARNAYELRKLLERVGQLPGVSMIPTVELEQLSGKYQVSWRRYNITETA